MLLKWLLRIKRKNQQNQQNRGTRMGPANSNNKITAKDNRLPQQLSKKLKILKPYIESNADIITRTFFLSGFPEQRVTVIYLEGVIDSSTLNQDVLKSLMLDDRDKLQQRHENYLIEHISLNLLTVGSVQRLDTPAKLVQAIFDGLTVLLVDGIAEALTLNIRGGEQRGIEEPLVERILRGSRESFNENLISSTALIRRRLRDPNLVVEKTIVGQRCRTDVAVLYIKDIADPKIIAKVKEKLAQINIDGILATGYLAQMLEDSPYSLFPQIIETELPDKIAAGLLEGRTAILVNNASTALLLPSLFVDFLQSPDDYYNRSMLGSFFRLLSFISFFLAISLPGLYIALIDFQIELVPFDLIVPLISARKQVPFPSIIEILLLDGVVQLIIHAGLRLPPPVGQTVGVVGGIVLGQAVISAKLATPAAIIVIALTTICTFGISAYGLSMAVRIIRLPVVLFSATFGLLGFSFSWLIILAHLANLESLGVPFFAPLGPMRYRDFKDLFVRSSLWKLKMRPVSIPMQDRQRQGNMPRKEKAHGK